METRKNIAAEKKRCGSHNCAQAILHTYADIAGIDEKLAMNIANSFGAGMGNMEGTCGGLVGAGLVLGLINKDKAKSMKKMRQIMNKFQERNGATQCRLLKGVGTKVVLRECPDCVADAAEFLEEELTQYYADHRQDKYVFTPAEEAIRRGLHLPPSLDSHAG